MNAVAGKLDQCLFARQAGKTRQSTNKPETSIRVMFGSLSEMPMFDLLKSAFSLPCHVDSSQPLDDNHRASK